MVARRMDVEIALRGKDEGAGSLVEGMGNRFKMLKKEARMSGELDLKRQLGGGNSVEAILNLIGGAKAGLGAFFIERGGEALNQWAEKAVDLKKELREGKITAGELVEKIAEGVPVFGPVIAAGRNIHELLTGEKLEIERINEEAAKTKEIFDTWSAAAISSKHAIADTFAELGKRRDLAAVADRHPLIQERTALQDDIKDHARKENAKSRDEKIAEGLSGNKEAAESWKKAREELAKLNEELNKNEHLQNLKKSLAGEEFWANDKNSTKGFREVAKRKAEEVRAEIEKISGVTEEGIRKQKELLNGKDGKGGLEADALKAQSATSDQDLEDKKQKLAAVNKEWKEMVAHTKEVSREGANKAAAEAARAELEASGKAFDAEIQTIKDKAAEDQASALEAAKQRIKDLKLDANSADAKQIMSDATNEQKSIGDRARAEEIQARKRQKIEEGDLDSDARQKELQAHGDMLGAQLEQINHSYADRIAMAKTQAEKEALARAQAADVAEAKRQAAIDKKERSFERKRQILGISLGELDERAGTSETARREAVKAHLRADSEQKIHDLQKVLDDKTASEQEKRDARAAMKRLKEDEARKEKAVDDSPIQDHRRGVQANLLNDGYHGLLEQYQSGGEPGLAEARKTATHTAYLKDINSNIAQLVKKGIAVKGRIVL